MYADYLHAHDVLLARRDHVEDRPPSEFEALSHPRSETITSTINKEPN